MKQISEKLRSNRGASAIIALVFMLICIFIGGSVLVAATVNSGRLQGRREEQQAVLTQRSLASTLISALTNKKGNIDLSVTLTTDAGSVKASVPKSDSGLKKIIETVFSACYNSKEETEFTVTVPVGSGDTTALSCYAVCSGEDIYIGFKDSPEIRVRFQGSKSSKAIKWTKAKIVKEGSFVETTSE